MMTSVEKETIISLERNETPEERLNREEEADNGEILYRVECSHLENAFVNYNTAKYVMAWVIMPVLFFAIATGITITFIAVNAQPYLYIESIIFYTVAAVLFIFPMCFLPLLRYIRRQELRLRRIYITNENVVLKLNVPAALPCLGNNKQEKHILLHLVTDVVVNEGWLMKMFGLQAVSIENAGQGGAVTARGQSVDASLLGIDDPVSFKRVLLAAARAKRMGLKFTKENAMEAAVGNSSAFSEEATAGITSGMGMGIGMGVLGYQASSQAADISQIQAAVEVQKTLQNLNESIVKCEKLLTEQVSLLQRLVDTDDK